jgi:ABC-type multidrug transport system permease subunit
MSTTFPNLLTFQIERPVFIREYSNQMYSVLPYYATKLMIDMPLMLLTPMLMECLVYWAVGFRHGASSFFKFYMVLELCVQTGSALGLSISTMAPNIVVATTIAPAFIMPMMLFGGLMVNPSTVFVWLRWIQWISPIRYTFECLCIVQFGDDYYGK